MKYAVDVDPLEPFGTAAARIVAQRAAELFATDGVLDTSDIEGVHDMRVASRRLRAVLEIFAPAFPRAEHKALLAEVKALADALGERRDPDVHIAALEQVEAAVPAGDRAGVHELVERQRARQAQGNATLAAALDNMHRSDLRLRLLALADAAELEL
jgi:CHAD domain-containing protein